MNYHNESCLFALPVEPVPARRALLVRLNGRSTSYKIWPDVQQKNRTSSAPATVRLYGQTVRIHYDNSLIFRAVTGRPDLGLCLRLTDRHGAHKINQWKYFTRTSARPLRVYNFLDPRPSTRYDQTLQS